MYDIAIIGSGPAGSTLARLLASKYRILLIDKRDLANENENNNIIKCCGGLLAPDAQHMIAKLGLGLPKSILVDPQLFTVRTIDLNNNVEKFYQRFYFNMDREKFDRWLVSLITDNVERRFNSMFKSFRRVEGGYEVKYTHNQKVYTEKVKIIVGADGGDSSIRRTAFKEKVSPVKYISIQEWFECPDSMPYFTAIFDESITDFYSWVIPKNHNILLGAALIPDKDANQKFEQLKDSLKNYGFKFNDRVKREGSFIYRPKSMSQLFVGEDNIALIGEAAGAISPSSAEGFSYAFKSALYLAESLDSGIDGFMRRYKRKVEKIKMNILLKNLKSPAMYNMYLRKLAMKSGLQSMDIETDSKNEYYKN